MFIASAPGVDATKNHLLSTRLCLNFCIQVQVDLFLGFTTHSQRENKSAVLVFTN